jgi:hypothetical protein
MAIHSKIIAVLYSELHVMQHVQRMRDYVLCAHGDLYAALCEQAHSEFDANAKTIYRHNMIAALGMCT